MSDETKDQNNGEEENFADLLESYSSRMNEDIRVGDKIHGEIISIGKDTVFVDTGTKIDGLVEKEELLDDKGELPYQVGDVLDLYIVSYSGGEIRLSRALSGVGGFHILQEAFENAVPVEGKVKGTVKGGLQVEIMQRRAFCPVSQIDLRFVENAEDYVGNTYSFLITRLEERGKNIIVSRRQLLEKEQEKAKKEFLDGIGIGDQLEGRVTKLMPFGAFVEVFPGLEGMVHVSELSWSRVSSPEEVIATGDIVTVKVIDLTPGKSPGQIRLSLSIKQVAGDPWESVLEKYHEGDKLEGKVRQCVPFGAFVEIAPGIEGLVHISEMSYGKRVTKPEEIVQTGQSVHVILKEIDQSKRRISLSLRDAEGDPWVDITKKYSVGQALEGTLEKREKFGFFITLEPGITGLLPISRIKGSRNPALVEKLKEGDRVSILIEEILPEKRKMTLAPADSRDEGDWRRFTKDSEKSFGSLGDKLRKALQSTDEGDSTS